MAQSISIAWVMNPWYAPEVFIARVLTEFCEVIDFAQSTDKDAIQKIVDEYNGLDTNEKMDWLKANT